MTEPLSEKEREARERDLAAWKETCSLAHATEPDPVDFRAGWGSAQARYGPVAAALGELVRLKDEKRARSQPPGVALSDEHHAYYQEKEAAWQAARVSAERRQA